MKPIVILGDNYLDSHNKLPKKASKKVAEFVKKFMQDPTRRGVNYETIQGAKDSHLKTVRIDIHYRAVVLQPAKGNLYTLLWVDNHDDAYEWGRKHVVRIHPITGALQDFDQEEAEKALPARGPAKTDLSLFQQFDDKELISLGTPSALLHSVKAITSKKDLEAVGKHLPRECHEALQFLVEGIPIEDVREMLQSQAPTGTVDTTDFEKALEHPDSRRRFAAIESVEKLEQVLSEPLQKWRIFLHPSQQRLISADFNGPVLVLGGPGTGKTVVAMHRARYLAKHVYTGDSDKILVTTFTKNLAEDLERNLKELCGDEFKRIQVTNLHAWFASYTQRQRGYPRIASRREVKTSLEDAISKTGIDDWGFDFLENEITQVIKLNGLTTEEEYLGFPRSGRGRRLSRSQRTKIWRVYQEYRKGIISRGKIERIDLQRRFRRQIQIKNPKGLFRAVVVDEAQDWNPEDWRLIRALAPKGKNDLFLVGDGHQRIYGPRVVLGKCGINVRGRTSRLLINYRTSREIRNWSVGVLGDLVTDDLSGRPDSHRGYTSLWEGVEPEIHSFQSMEEEGEFLVGLINELLGHYDPSEICIVHRNMKQNDHLYSKFLDDAKIPFFELRKTDDPSVKGVRLATMHRVKGLEFRCMILSQVSKGVIPEKLEHDSPDPIVETEHEAKERSLLYVAASRARDRLIVTWLDEPSPYLPK